MRRLAQGLHQVLLAPPEVPWKGMLLWDFQIKLRTRGHQDQGLIHCQCMGQGRGAGRTKPKARFRGEGTLWAAGVGGLGAGTHEDAPNPNRGLWQLAAALLMETEHSPKGADSAAQGGQGQAVGLWGR